MTARQGKRMTTGMMILLAVAIVADVIVTLVKHRPLGEITSMLPGLLLILMFASMRSRFARMEAEHGPDFVAARTGGRSLIVLAALLVAIFAGLVAFLLAHRP